MNINKVRRLNLEFSIIDKIKAFINMRSNKPIFTDKQEEIVIKALS